MRCLFVASILLLTAACSDDSPPPASPADPPAAEQQVVSGPGSAVTMLPGGIELDVPVHLRSDRSVEGKGGAVRRRLVYELLEAGPGESEQVISQVLSDAGYVGGKKKKGKKGRYAIRYKKEGAPTIKVTFYPAPAKKPANPEAKSMVAFSWKATPIKKAANAGS